MSRRVDPIACRSTDPYGCTSMGRCRMEPRCVPGTFGPGRSTARELWVFGSLTARPEHAEQVYEYAAWPSHDRSRAIYFGRDHEAAHAEAIRRNAAQAMAEIDAWRSTPPNAEPAGLDFRRARRQLGAGHQPDTR